MTSNVLMPKATAVWLVENTALTFEQIASTLEEVEITKEQVTQLHAHLVEHGVDAGLIHGPDGRQVRGRRVGRRPAGTLRCPRRGPGSDRETSTPGSKTSA